MSQVTNIPTFKIRAVWWSLDYDSANEDNKLVTPILLQDENGPCPLIALINTLLLNYELYQRMFEVGLVEDISDKKLAALHNLKTLLLTNEASTGTIALVKILSQLGDMLLVYVENKSLQYEVDKLLESLPLLHTGLSVNANLINGDFAHDDLASILFDVFDLKFKHGWCINQIDSERVDWNDSTEDISSEDNYATLVDIFNQLQTFDKIQDYLLDDNAELAHNQKLIRKWLDLNRTQLTTIGLNRLNIDLVKEEFVIFFRNNHFNTFFKKGNQEFYLLITDASFNNKASKIVWQSLNSISGKDDLFFTGDFLPILDIDQDLPGESNDDYLFSKRLQEEEDNALAKQMQETYSKQDGAKGDKKDKKNKDKDKKKKRDCIIV